MRDRVMAGIEKDHWLWNTRADDTGSIVECYTSFFIDSRLRGAFYGLQSRLVNLLSLVRLRTSQHSRRYGVTITGLLVTVYPAGHPRYGDARATPSSKSQLSSLLECLHVHVSFSWQTLFTASCGQYRHQQARHVVESKATNSPDE